MAKDMFGGLGGLGSLVKGLSNIMPQDDPNVKMFNAASSISELEGKINDLYAQIGKMAYPEVSQKPEYEDLVLELRVNQKKLSEAREQADAMKAETEKAKAQAEAAEALTRCPNCDFRNEPGTKFCAECGTRLPSGPATCPSCGITCPPGTKFCGSCGSQVG